MNILICVCNLDQCIPKFVYILICVYLEVEVLMNQYKNAHLGARQVSCRLEHGQKSVNICLLDILWSWQSIWMFTTFSAVIKSTLWTVIYDSPVSFWRSLLPVGRLRGSTFAKNIEIKMTTTTNKPKNKIKTKTTPTNKNNNKKQSRYLSKL